MPSAAKRRIRMYPARLYLPADVVHREQDDEPGGVADDDVEEERVGVEHHHAAEAA
jgi:hypothetical protein